MSSLSLSENATQPGLRRQWTLLATWGLGALVFFLPIAFPLGIGRDYPNHLARVFIQYRLEGDALLAANYGLDWRLIPDLAMDLLAAPLAGRLSPYLVGGVFNGLTLLLVFSAAVALQCRKTKQTSLWCLLPVALLFNEALNWGFMNFLFAVGLALWLVYFWLESEAWPTGRRVLVFGLAQLVLFFAHLLGFLLCGYLILCLELARLWRRRERGLQQQGLTVFVCHMLQFALPVLLFGYLLFFQDGVGDSRTFYGGFGAKALAFLSPTAALGGVPGALVLLALLLLSLGALRRGPAQLDRDLKPLLWPMLALVVAMPSMVFGIWGLDFRFPFVALLLLLAAVQPAPRIAAARPLQAVVALLVVSTLGAGAFQMYSKDRDQQEIRQAFARVEAGGALLVAGDYDQVCRGCFPSWVDYMHAGSLAAIERQMFVPLLFTATSPVQASPARARLDVPHGWPVSRRSLIQGRERPLGRPAGRHDPAHAYWHDWPRHFDYLLWLRKGPSGLEDLGGLEPLAEGSTFVLYRIVRPMPRGAYGR